MSEKNPDGSYTHTPGANDLDVFDPNVNLPSEPPPSYDEAMADPSIPDEDTPPETPLRPPQTPSRSSSISANSEQRRYSRPTAPPPSKQDIKNSNTKFNSTSNSTTNPNIKFSRPPVSPPSKTSTSQNRPQSTNNLPKPTPINPNPYLPWKYPSSYRCSKCDNTGYKKKNGHPCKTCWGRFRPQTVPPATSAELERLVKHKPKPKPINPNVVKLPPGTTVMPRYPTTQAPVVVQPGDPRIGGVLCPRCNGRGMVHFFLDLERCTQCNGLGRVGSNGRPL